MLNSTATTADIGSIQNQLYSLSNTVSDSSFAQSKMSTQILKGFGDKSPIVQKEVTEKIIEKKIITNFQK